MTPPWWRSAVFYQIYPRSFAEQRPGARPATSPASRHASTTSSGSASTPCGCRRSTRRRRPTSATTSPTSATSTPSSATSPPSTACWPACHERGLRLLVDFVPNHTSDQHPWFLAARSSRDDPKRDWYVWRDGDPDTPPNNWRRGVHRRAGVDVGRRHRPVVPPPVPAAAARPQLGQPRGRRGHARRHAVLARPRRRRLPHRRRPRHRQGPGAARRPARGRRASPTACSTTRPETHELIRGMRELVDAYPGDRLILGEVYLLSTPSRSPTYYGDGDELHLAFNFPPLYTPWDAAPLAPARSPTPTQLDRRPRRLADLGAVEPRQRPPPHPLRRPRTGPAPPLFLLLGLRGSPVLYAGEELGLEDAVRPARAGRRPRRTRRLPGARSRGPARPTTAGASPTPGCRGRPTPTPATSSRPGGRRAAPSSTSTGGCWRPGGRRRRCRLGDHEPVDVARRRRGLAPHRRPGGRAGPGDRVVAVNMGAEPADARRGGHRRGGERRRGRGRAVRRHAWPPTTPSCSTRRLTGSPRLGRRGAARRRQRSRRRRLVRAGLEHERPSPSNARAASPSSRSLDRQAGDVGPPAREQPRRAVAPDQRLDVGPGGDQRGVEVGVAGQLADPGRGQRHRRAEGRVDPVAGRQAQLVLGQGERPPRPPPAARRRRRPCRWRPSRPRTRPRSPRVRGGRSAMATTARSGSTWRTGRSSRRARARARRPPPGRRPRARPLSRRASLMRHQATSGSAGSPCRSRGLVALVERPRRAGPARSSSSRSGGPQRRAGRRRRRPRRPGRPRRAGGAASRSGGRPSAG